LQSVVVEPSHRGSVDLNNSEAIIIEEETPANEETADVKEEESTTVSPDSVIPPTPETDGVAAHVMNKFYVPKSKKGTNRRASDESSPSLEQAMKNELDSSVGIDVSPELPKKENVAVKEKAKEETKKEDNQEKRVSWDVDLEDGEEVTLPNEIDEQQTQKDDDQQPIFKFNYHPSPHEKEYYEKLCTYAKNHNSPDITNDIVSPGAAAKLFITSGIPSDRLRMIWNMSVLPAVPYPPGIVPPPAMTSGQFYASVRLIQLFQNRITAKDEMLRVDEGVDMSPAYFAGVSGVLIPLPDEDAMLPSDFGEGVPPTTVVPSDNEAAATPQVSNKKEQNGMGNEGIKEEEPPKKRVSGALRNSNKMRNSVAGEEKMRRNSTINERSHQARRATDPDSVDPKSSVSRSITGALASVVEDDADKVNTPSAENAPPQSQKEKDQEYNNKVRRRRSSLGDENEKIIWTRAMKRMSSIGAGSVTATSASDEAMRRRSSAFPPIMSVGVQAMQDESVIAYDGAENEYFMSQGEYLTYQGTFSRHCVTEVVGDHAEQYVYVEAALALFEKSGLNRDTIGKLWDVVVLNPDAGKLNEVEFVLLTHLIVCCTRKNLKEPTELPVPLRLWRENQVTPEQKEEEVKQNNTVPSRVEVEASEEASYVPTNTAVPTTRLEVEASEEVSYVPPPPTNIPTRNTVHIEPSEEVSHVSPNTGVRYQYKSKTSSNSNKSLTNEDNRYKRMEREIRSLATLVGSLTTEIHDLKGMMHRKTSPISVARMTSSHQQHNGMKNGVKRTSRGRAAPQAAISVPARKPKPYEIDENAPNEEVEMYWGDKNDDTNDLDRSERSAKSNVSTKKWKCDVGCDAVFDDYNICLAHERTCQGGNRSRPISPLGDTDPYSQPAAPPKRLTASERLRISREKKEETKRNLRLSRNVPSFHPSSLPSSSAPRSQMNRSMPQSRVDMARDAGNGVARSMMINGAPQQHQRSTTRESMMRNLRQGSNNASFRPAKLQPIPKNNRQPGLEDISERSSEQEQSPVPAGILKGGKNYLDVSERSATSRTSYSRSMPVNNTSPSSSGMPPRPQQMNRSMPNPGASQTMSDIEHRRLLAEQFIAPQQTEPGNLASQMQQVQREEQFDNLMQTTLNRFGSDSVTGSITSGSAAPSMNRGPNRHQQNDLNASFKPVQLNRSRQLRQQKNLGASVRHVYRRKSGTTEAYKTTARKSTMALDLPPLS